MPRPWNVVVLAGVLATATFETPGATRGALRWGMTFEKEVMGLFGSRGPGVHEFLGPQEAFRVRIGLSNFEGPTLNVGDVAGLLSVTLTQEATPVPIDVERVARSAPPMTLDAGESLDLSIMVRRKDRSKFDSGTYSLAVDLSQALETVRTSDGQPWPGPSTVPAKTVDHRTLIVREVRTADDRVLFNKTEGSYQLQHGTTRKAIAYLEAAVRDLPKEAPPGPPLSSWHQVHMNLGTAYMRTRQYARAAISFELVLPAWIRFSERRVDAIPNALAKAYVALKRDADAARVLRTAGVAEAEIPKRLQTLRQSIERR